ncbi:MAG: tRNA (adenosine(37)-N6)-threonylcarbamoyltransferase complex ATPase subunit type 1 TsaE [Gemmatimonadota bacterium]
MSISDTELFLDELELRRWGFSRANSLEPGAVVWLSGDLGAGKTTLVQGIAAGLGVAGSATSPTYNLVHRYEGSRGAVYHVDCYRMNRPDEGGHLDWAGMLAADALIVEWPERAAEWVPKPDLWIELEHLPDPSRRRLTIRLPVGS